MRKVTALPPAQQQDVGSSVLVVLAAGAVTQDFVSVMNSTSPAMLPYMGRPLIYQIIVNHIKRYSSDVVIALPATEPPLAEFLTVTFGRRVNLIMVSITDRQGTPVTSLQSAVRAAAARGLAARPAYIVYGDVYFEPVDIVEGSEPVVFVDDYIESDKYSHFVSDGGGFRHVEPVREPGVERPVPEGAFTDIGAYWVPVLGDVGEDKVDHAVAKTVGGLIVRVYQGKFKLSKVKTWSDLGHLDTATQIRTRLIGARQFNTISIDEDRGLITKSSTNRDKLLQEINYYTHLPRELTIYFPRLHDYKTGKKVSYTLEYYSYRTLAEYLVFFSFPVSVWKKIIDRLVAIHHEFAAHQGDDADQQGLRDFYLGKLTSRMDDLDPDSAIAALVGKAEVVVNGVRRSGWRAYLDLIEETVERVSRSPRTGIIHGDYCFSNILYDPQTGLVKLIDPRGEFFEEGCYGDPRYDLAKLLHSFHGGYDFIMQEMYDLREEAPGEYRLRLFRSTDSTTISAMLVEQLARRVSYDIKDLLVLEALLFLSMLPLHADDGDRQKALYLTGIEILHEVLGEDLHRSGRHDL